MNAYPPPFLPARSRSNGKILVVVLILVGLFGLAVADCFRMDADGRALRDALKRGSHASFSRVFQGGAGPVLLGMARVGLRFADDLPGEARRGAASVRSARVSVDRVEGRLNRGRLPQMMAEADRVMTGRGWERLVCVRESGTLVLVYIDASSKGGSTVPTRLAVLESEQLVVVSAKLRLQPLIDLGLDAMNQELEAATTYSPGKP